VRSTPEARPSLVELLGSSSLDRVVIEPAEERGPVREVILV
jgi:hypothetical protein